MTSTSAAQIATTPVAADGWALWRPDGALDAIFEMPEGHTDPWQQIFRFDVPGQAERARAEGWTLDGISAEAWLLLKNNPGFQSPHSREVFHEGWDEYLSRQQLGVPEPHAWVAWAPDGEAMALGLHVPGLTGWTSLGIGSPAEGCTLDEITAAEYEYLGEGSGLHFRTPGGRGAFLQLRNVVSDATRLTPTKMPVQDLSALTRAFTEALIAHGPRHGSDVPENITAQYLVGCLTTLHAAIDGWAEQVG
jgi:hypothetical protein